MKRSYLRVLAITLIVLPEPVTTPFGILLLLISFLLPRKHKDSLRNLEDLVKRYRVYAKTTQFKRSANSTEPVVFHPLQQNTLIPQANVAGGGVMSRSLTTPTKVRRTYVAHYHVTKQHKRTDKKNSREYQFHQPIDNHKAVDKITHHVLRKEEPPYEAGPTQAEPVVHHTLKKTRQPSQNAVLYPGLRPMKPAAEPQKVVHHSLKRQ
jgi:hypothetical protein